MATADATIRIVAQDKTGTAFKKVKGNLDKTQKAFTSLGRAIKIGFTLIIAGGIAKLVNFTDQFALLEARTKKASKGLGDYNKISAELFTISQRTGTALEDTVKLFEALARTAPDIGATRDQVMQMTESLEMMAVVSGATGEEIKNAMRQFSQAMAGGIVRAEEFNSIIENTPEIAAKIAEGMGMTVGQLRLAVVEGKVLSKDVFESILGQTAQINADFEAMPMTFSRAFTMLKNSAQRFLGIMNEAGGATGVLADAVVVIARAFDALTRRIKSGRLAAEFSLWAKALGVAVGYVKDLGKEFGKLFRKLSGGTRVFDAMLEFPLTFSQLVISLAATFDKVWATLATSFKVVVLKMSKIWYDFKIWFLARWVEMLKAAVTALDNIGLDAMAEKIAGAVQILEGRLHGMGIASKEMARWTDELNESLEKEKGAIDAVATEMIRELELAKERHREMRTGIEDTEDASESMRDLDGALKDATKSTSKFKDAFSKMFDDIRGAWSTMWEGLFTGKGIDSVKDFLKEVKNIFLKTLAEIAAEWTWNAIFGKLVGGDAAGSILGKVLDKIVGAFTSGGETAGGGFTTSLGTALQAGWSKISTAIKAGASTVGSWFGKIFGTSASSAAFSSSGSFMLDASGNLMTIGGQAGTAFTTGLKATLANAAGLAVPLAIAIFGFSKGQKFKKMLTQKFAEVINDPTVFANLADGPLAQGFKVLGQVGDETFVQISESAAAMFDNFSETSGGAFQDVGGSLGMLQFGLEEMRDEFGNVIVTATDFAGLMEHLEQMEPFVKQAEEIMASNTALEIQKENIDLVNSALFRAKVAFEKMGDSGKKALGNVDKKSQTFINIMQRGFVNAVDYAALGLKDMGAMSSEMFAGMVDYAQDATGEMNALGRAAQNAINTVNTANALKDGGGMQHGGSFIVGGGGGTDSQPVAFMATPGERVTVDTPNQARASGSDGGGVVKELRALRRDLANVAAKPIVGAVTRGQLAMAGGARH